MVLIPRMASLLLLALWTAQAVAVAPQERSRTWRDQQGREIVGRLVGIDGDHVILRSEGQDVAIEYSQLSDTDQDYLQGKKFAGDPVPSSPDQPPAGRAQQPAFPQPPPPPAAAEPRAWTVGKKQVVGAWAGADETAFYVQTASGESRITYDAISNQDDALEVSHRLDAAGREDLAQRVVAAYERNTGQSLFASGQSPAASDPANPSRTDPAQPPLNQNMNVATEPTDLPARPKKVDIVTADEVFAEHADAQGSAADDSERRLRNRTILGALALVALVSVVLTYGWMSTKRG
jgi:hypothetical protein